jgi:predicted nuclease of predicted toxin-antitoxin system
MRVLIDECIPRKLKYSLPEHDCRTVPEAGFAGKKNGFLLDLAEKAGFEIFVTMDKGLEYQQNLAGRSISILILRSKSNRLAHLLPLVPDLLRSMMMVRKGEVQRIIGDEQRPDSLH